MNFHFLDVSYDEKERWYFGPILTIRLQSAQVFTAGQTSFIRQETGKVASCVVLEVIRWKSSTL